MTVLVAMPYHEGTAPYVERAVRSVLAQTHRDLVCVVIGDGGEPPLHVRDDRLVVHTYAANRGPYFAQDVAIWASPFEWYAPVATDDWLDPDHLERLLDQGGDRCSGGVRYHNEHFCPGDPDHVACAGTPVPAAFAAGARKAYEVGLYRTERYTEIGAHNPTERIGQDSLTLKVMRIVAPVLVSDHMTYNRLGRPDSLSTHPDTNRDSPARQAMRRRNRDIVARCLQLRTAARIRQYRDSLIPAEVRDALAREVDAMRDRLGVAVAA